MKVTVLSIQPALEDTSHEVLLSIGADMHKFLFTTEVNKVGDKLLHTTDGDRNFSEVFKFNQRVAMNVSKLVVKFYNKEIVELPADVGNFVTAEEAVSKLKSFEPERMLESGDRAALRQQYRTGDITTKVQSTEEIIEVRHKAIALLEKLPDAMLDEAIQFLESLSIKAKNFE